MISELMREPAPAPAPEHLSLLLWHQFVHGHLAAILAVAGAIVQVLLLAAERRLDAPAQALVFHGGHAAERLIEGLVERLPAVEPGHCAVRHRRSRLLVHGSGGLEGVPHVAGVEAPGVPDL